MNLNERQRCLLIALLKHHSLSCNAAGDRLARHKLLKRNGASASNLCLCGAAVMNSLERRGLVVRFSSSRDQWAIRLYALSKEGRKLAKQLEQKVVPS